MNTQPIDEKVIFNAARSIADPAARAAFVAQACGDNEPAIRRIEELLRIYEQEQSFLESPPIELSPTTDSSPIREGPGTIIGPYKLLQQIGEGGMGVVFMAEQSEPIQRTVALKIIKPGMDTRQVIARFEAERQALAMMDHPNIARVIDAGTTATGRPYFVMDLVKGVPITEYCDQQHLPVRARLELMAEVCQAVQHAHQKGIIHRDLKPSNVLVAEYDGRPVPKIIDFGVAKATAQKLTERTMFTEYGQLIGTFEYMSPEQARFNQLDVDTRSDIYSLGVLLYEVLAGSTPLEKERLRSAAFDEVLRIICEEEPPRPSMRLSSSQMLPSISAQRQIEPVKLTKVVRGELDWIAMKCLEKDRNRRYETASALAVDLQRYLADEPVEARPSTRMYQLKKFIRRNKVGALSGAAVVVALTLGTLVSTWQALRADRQANIASAQEQIARTQAVRSEQVAKFLKDMLAAAGPQVARGRDATLLREILDATANRVQSDLKGQPEVAGDLWLTLGTTYFDIGDDPRAITMYQRGVDSYRLALGGENSKLALALASLGRRQSFRGDLVTGQSNAKLGLDMARKSDDAKTLASCLYCMARSCNSWGRGSAKAVPYLRESLAIHRQLHSDPVALADCAKSLATCDAVDLAERVSLVREVLALDLKQLGPDHPRVAGDRMILGQVLAEQGKLVEAEAELRETVALNRKFYDANHSSHGIVKSCLIKVVALQGKWDDAEALIRTDLDAEPENPYHWDLLGRFYAFQGLWPTAIEHFSRARQLKPDLPLIDYQTAIALLQSNRREEYQQYCHEYLARVAGGTNSDAQSSAAKVALLLPVDGTDFKQACAMADSLSTTEPRDPSLFWKYLTKALSDFRQDRFDAASDHAERSLATADALPECQAAAWFIHAAACARMKQLESARESFSKGSNVLKLHNTGINLHLWRDWTIADRLRREAAELLSTPEPQTSTEKPAAGDKTPNTNDPKPDSALNPKL